MSKIIKITNQLFQVPLTETLVDAKHGDHTHFELVTCTIDLDDDDTSLPPGDAGAARQPAQRTTQCRLA